MGLDGVEIFTNSSGSHHELRKLYRRVEVMKEATEKVRGRAKMFLQFTDISVRSLGASTCMQTSKDAMVTDYTTTDVQ